MDISGNTRLIAHIGYPTQTFKAPLIYNPYFQSAGLDVVVVPFASQSDGYPALLRARRRRDRWSAEDQRLYRRHRWRLEGLHGEAKTWHGLARAVRPFGRHRMASGQDRQS